MDWQAILDTVINWATNSGIKIVIGLVVLFVSFKLINMIGKKIIKRNEKKQRLDKTITRTLVYIAKIVLKIAITICIIGYVGIDTSGLTALVASVGVCVGLAVNGALSNLAGGIMLIITRPFKIDDFIEACGYSGVVEAINMTQTRIRTGDNKIVYIPNGTLSSAEIVNYSITDTRRLDLTFSIAYENDFEKAKEILLDLCKKHELVLESPAPMVRVSGHNTSSIDILTRVWTKSGDYWTVNFDLLEQVKLAFDKNGIEIPYNKLDVNVKKDA